MIASWPALPAGWPSLDIDPTVVRILWIVVGIASGGLVLLAYLILALVIPQAPSRRRPVPRPAGPR